MLYSDNLTLKYEPNVKQAEGYSAFLDFATADEATRAHRDLEVRQAVGDLVGGRKLSKTRGHIQLRIEGETKTEKKRRDSLARSHLQKELPRQLVQSGGNQLQVVEPTNEPEQRKKRKPRPKSTTQPESEQEGKDQRYFLRISNLPYNATEADIKDLLGWIQTFVLLPHPNHPISTLHKSQANPLTALPSPSPPLPPLPYQPATQSSRSQPSATHALPAISYLRKRYAANTLPFRNCTTARS